MDLELPRFMAKFTVKMSGSADEHVFKYEDTVPESVMDAYRQVVGDGLAKVTVSTDFSIKDFGAGVTSMVAVTLTCGQCEDNIRAAAGLAMQLAQGFAQQNAATAYAQFRPMVEAAKLGAPLPRGF